MSPQLLPVLLTRPADASARFATLLEGPVLISPLAEPVMRAVAVPQAAGVIFTSANAVAALGGQRPARRAWCVGDRTARAARAAGFDARSAAGDAETLFAAICASGDAGPFVHPRGQDSRGDLAARLTAVGIPVQEVVVYHMAPRPLTATARALLDRDTVVPLFSPLSARRFFDACPMARAICACLSDAVAAELPAPLRRHVAARPDAPAMADLVRVLQGLETARGES